MVQKKKIGVFWQLIALPFVLFVRFYRLFSPIKKALFGPHAGCRFHPTCSEYALECLSIFSLPKAIFKTALRIARCNPLHPGGYDPVNKEQKTCGNE